MQREIALQIRILDLGNDDSFRQRLHLQTCEIPSTMQSIAGLSLTLMTKLAVTVGFGCLAVANQEVCASPTVPRYSTSVAVKPAGSPVLRPELLLCSLSPGLASLFALGVSPKRPAARKMAVDAHTICTRCSTLSQGTSHNDPPLFLGRNSPRSEHCVLRSNFTLMHSCFT